jgi:hypothetical protein
VTKGPPQQMLRTHRSLKASCATLWWRWKMSSFFSFLQVMEHRWNEIGRGKRKYSGRKPVPVPLCSPQIPHGLTRDRTRASADALSYKVLSCNDWYYQSPKYWPFVLNHPLYSVYLIVAMSTKLFRQMKAVKSLSPVEEEILQQFL